MRKDINTAKASPIDLRKQHDEKITEGEDEGGRLKKNRVLCVWKGAWERE